MLSFYTRSSSPPSASSLHPSLSHFSVCNHWGRGGGDLGPLDSNACFRLQMLFSVMQWVYVGACACTQEQCTSGRWRKKSDTLELELWVAVSQLMWGPGTELRSPGTEAEALNHGASSPAPLFSFFQSGLSPLLTNQQSQNLPTITLWLFHLSGWPPPLEELR